LRQSAAFELTADAAKPYAPWHSVQAAATGCVSEYSERPSTIYQAIKKRNHTAAKKAMRHHLLETMKLVSFAIKQHQR
jgi:DNA-binding GntR family transcriptional regulator